MANVEKVLIVGAGIGGLAAGALFGQRGAEVEIVEIKPEANVYGVGINQPGNSLRALREIGVLPEILAVGFEFDRWIFHDYRGELIVDVPSRLGGDGIPPNCALSRRALQEILIGAADRAGVRVRYGTTLDDFSEAEGQVEVCFSDGGRDSYDLVVGFDGIKSPLRSRLFQRFTRGDMSRNRAAGSSTGLGLAIVHAVVTAHSGTIDVDGTPGQTSFTVTLPAAP